MATTQHRRRVPETKSEFDNYQKDSTTHLETGTPARGEELGLITAELDDWKDFRDDWVVLYPKYTNKNIRTTTITENVNTHIKSFALFAEPLLNRISGSAVITSDDRNALNIKERDKTPTRRGLISDVPIVGIKGVGGGRLKIKVRTDSDSSRASVHPLADLIEVRYMLVDEEPEVPGPGPAPDPGSGIPTPEKASHYFVSSKASFEIETGSGSLGKYVMAFLRWVNSSTPANNGPWTLPQIGLIS